MFHVAGTNGKGSTCAYLRAILEAEGMVVHTAIKPHLVRFNERIRIAGELISTTELLAALLNEVLDIGEDLEPELLRSHHRGDLPRLRAHSGRRLRDRSRARRPVRRHQRDGAARPPAASPRSASITRRSCWCPRTACRTEPLVRIAFEKAGIARAGSPLATQSYPPALEDEIARIAGLAGRRCSPAWRTNGRPKSARRSPTATATAH